MTKKLEIARNMLKKEISIETIIECTGLTKEEIEILNEHSISLRKPTKYYKNEIKI